MPVLFRTIYACGLRCSEARLLRVDDVDTDAGVLRIRDAKGGKDRQVPVCEALRARLARYHAQVAGQPGQREWFFPGRPGQPLTLGNVGHNFRRFLWQARISRSDAGHLLPQGDALGSARYRERRPRQPLAGPFLASLRGCSMIASGPGNTRAV